MSSEIFYDRAFIRVDNKFIPLCNHGSSNCFDSSLSGREIPERHWSVLNYPNRRKFLFSKDEMEQQAKIYEEANTGNRGGTRKSRYTSFEVGEFGRWILGGIRFARTVEEYSRYGNQVQVIDYGDGHRRHTVRTTEELLTKLEELSGTAEIGITFSNERKVWKVPVTAKHDLDSAEEYYVLGSKSGYFIKIRRGKVWQTKSLFTDHVHKFRKEGDAQKYLDAHSTLKDRHGFIVQRIERYHAEDKLSCKICGAWLTNTNSVGIGYASSHYNGTDICDDCMLEHCLSTNCLGCELGSYPDCQFLSRKKFYQEEKKKEGVSQ